MKKKRLISLLLALCMAFALLPAAAQADPGAAPTAADPAVLAATPNVLSIKITMTTPEVGKPLPTTAKTSKTANYEVTKVEWSGQLDGNGNMAYDTVYTAVFTVEIKKGKDTKFSTAAAKEFVKNASINGEYKGFTKAEKVSDTMVKLTYELPAVKPPSTTISKLDTIHLNKPSVGHAPDESGYTSNSAKIKVTETKWSGAVDNYGLAIAGVAYTYTFTVEIKPEYDLTFATGALKATINSSSDGVTVERVSDKKAIVTYTSPVLAEKEKPAADKSKTFTQAEADANCPKLKPITIVVSEDNQDMDFINNRLDTFAAGFEVHNFLSSNYHTLDGDVVISKDSPRLGGVYGEHFDYFRIDRIVYDLYRKDDFSVIKYYTAKELWLSPKCDIQGILDGIGRQTYHHGFNTYDYTVFIPDSVYPNGPTYKSSVPPGCRVMLYSGSDVYAAAEKGKDAAREWCFNHSYTAKIEQRDRIYSDFTCYCTKLYYYSCSKCGKCEYNPNHTFVSELTFGAGGSTFSEHQYETLTISDEHFLGTTPHGDQVFLKACEWCGKDRRQVDTAKGEGQTWTPGGYCYEKAMTYTPYDKVVLYGAYVISGDAYVWETVSSWARNEVQGAGEAGLIDRAILGNNYTGTINRLQFCSIAVKMAEKMLGKTIAPAPSGTFTDTDNEYVRKASAAGITSGVGDNKFDPNGTLTRQQMATFLYRALMYVKANSDIEYTVYESKLGSYTDAGQLQSWAKDAMAFMNALGLIAGTSDTTLSPNNPCTIEQALIVADRSLDAGVIGWYQYVGADSDTPATYNYPGYGNINHGDRIWFTSADGDCTDTHGIKCSVVVKNNNYYPIKDR
ncbi:MAG: S-layer homology domain-containing protein [Oscillospiraceae bacterium]|nr:S-layer homology domain-containing protein [Oscillospiraceae bacterium]